MGELYIALVHAPVYNKNMEEVATSITNLDLHDIARCSATYGLQRYYVVHPAPAQHALAQRIMGFWREGFGAEYNPDRYEAFSRVRLVASVEDALSDIAREQEGKRVHVIATDARLYPDAVSYESMRKKIEETPAVFLLLFGTGWGLLKEVVQSSDYILQPVYGPGEYNHLSVRSAAAVILDRLCGR
ncbi:Protein of unknown function DUF2168 [Syntrophobotulus glycolicus DSM 8271]|uniref:tRNA (guanine-N(1)-)-methyltransferase C-terminal domain-containing protein n=1 Tax=Syntrophobotulus glycolicus (strain DSM 8271 / FlGlyR) TaxID=645991 RepID=F0SUD9_SYNGF|nr:RNA methyltransferase [Syntrophobotulus glycolicus]ADY56589.1 Protein of unknown function DUF2168 [Syntrophobotulus glycolicus DSM 8271]